MKKAILCFFLCVCNPLCVPSHAEIHIVLTAALIDNQSEERREEYTRTLSILNDFGYTNPYVIESVSSGSTFLDDYSQNVLYTKTNNLDLRNKGVNEGMAIMKSLDKLPFQDEDMVVKITGRYHLLSDTFLQTIQSNPSVDIFAKLAPDGQIYTGCFAMRYRYFKELFGHIDYEKMERDMINLEQEAANYIQMIAETQRVHIMYLDKLDVLANIFGTGHREIVEW